MYIAWNQIFKQLIDALNQENDEKVQQVCKLVHELFVPEALKAICKMPLIIITMKDFCEEENDN